jgi:hypothetical protein
MMRRLVLGALFILMLSGCTHGLRLPSVLQSLPDMRITLWQRTF